MHVTCIQMNLRQTQNFLSFRNIYLSSIFLTYTWYSFWQQKNYADLATIHFRLRCFSVATSCSSGVVTDFPTSTVDFAIQIRSVQHHQCWQNARRRRVVSVNRSWLSGTATHNARASGTTSFELSDDTSLALSVSRFARCCQLLVFSFTSPAIVRWYLTLAVLLSLHASILRCFSMRCCSRFMGETNPSRHTVQTFLSFIMWICDFVWRFRSDCVTPL